MEVFLAFCLIFNLFVSSFSGKLSVSSNLLCLLIKSFCVAAQLENEELLLLLLLLMLLLLQGKTRATGRGSFWLKVGWGTTGGGKTLLLSLSRHGLKPDLSLLRLRAAEDGLFCPQNNMTLRIVGVGGTCSQKPCGWWVICVSI